MVAITAEIIRLRARPYLAASVFAERDFRSLFGASPDVCALTWNLLEPQTVSGDTVEHLLWALLLMKTYAKEAVLCKIAGASRTTFRKRAWKWILLIASLRNNVIQLGNRFRQDKGRTCKMTIDGTDCPIQEPVPFSKVWYTPKFNGAGLRYEVGVCIQTGDICWINGPFKPGRWPDLSIFRRDLRQRLLPGEKVECDAGYGGEPCCRNKDIIVNPADARAKAAARTRHETVNSDIKIFGCLGSAGPWRHDRHLHKFAFAAAAVMTQLGYNHGYGPYQVVY